MVVKVKILNQALHFLPFKGCMVFGVIDQVSRAGHLGVIRLAFSTFPSMQSSSECNYCFSSNESFSAASAHGYQYRPHMS